MTRTNAEITLEEIFKEFNLVPDRHSLEYRHALDVLEKSYDLERDGAFDEGFDEGKSDDGYEAGKESAWGDFNFRELVEFHLENTFGSSASIHRIDVVGDVFRVWYRHRGETPYLIMTMEDVLEL